MAPVAIDNPKQKEKITKAAKSAITRRQLMDLKSRISVSTKRATIVEKARRHASVLSPAERQILQKPHCDRTEEERKFILNSIVSQACFKRFPPKVRARLATVLHFMEVSAGKILFKQGHKPESLYFLISGNVAKLSRKFNEGKNRHVVKVEYLLCPPEMVGEIELLEGFNQRMHTYRAKTTLELFALDLDDFDTILRPAMLRQWNDNKITLDDLGYFEHFTTEQRLSALHFAQLRQFEAYEHVYPNDNDPISYLYFLCAGECAIVQNLKMKVEVQKKEKKYNLVDIEEDDIVEEVLRTVDQEETKTHNQRYESALVIEDAGEKSEERKKAELVEQVVKSCGLADNVSGLTLKRSLRFDLRLSEVSRTGSLLPSEMTLSEEQYEQDEYAEELEMIEESLYSEDSDVSEPTTRDTIFRQLYNIPSSLSRIAALKNELECHIVDIGTLTRGAVFGLGEKWEHRLLMARTSVQCILLPRYWLVSRDQNPGNIWQRRGITLNFAIPSREILFQDFIRTRNWEKCKEKIVSEAVDKKNIYQPWLLSIFE